MPNVLAPDLHDQSEGSPEGVALTGQADLPEPPPDEDGLLAVINAVQRAADAAARALTAISEGLEAPRRQLAMGRLLPPPVDSYLRTEGVEARQRAAVAIHEYQRASMLLRAEVTRRLVDDHGYSLTEVAKTMRISRQMVARLRDAGRSGTFGTSDFTNDEPNRVESP